MTADYQKKKDFILLFAICCTFLFSSLEQLNIFRELIPSVQKVKVAKVPPPAPFVPMPLPLIPFRKQL